MMVDAHLEAYDLLMESPTSPEELNFVLMESGELSAMTFGMIKKPWLCADSWVTLQEV